MKKLAIVTSHPIQYYAPLFRLLALQNDICLKVFYTWGKESIAKYDPGFKQRVKWDIPLLDGYNYEFFKNSSHNPGSNHFRGIINPDGINRIQKFNPDAILIFGWKYQSHLNIIRHFSKTLPIWFKGDSTLLDEKKGIKKYVRYCILRWVYSHINKAFYAGTNNKSYFEKFGLKQDQLVFTPHAIDNDRFSINDSISTKKLRTALEVRDNELLVLFAGKFEKKKDPILLLNAFIESHTTNTHLLFVGNGELEDELKHKSTVLPKHIHFMNFQNQGAMPIIYHACDLFCLPSKGPGETWGLAVNEAMAAGKAILISDKVGCGVDLVKPGVNGEIFYHGNKEDLISKLRNLKKKSKLEEYGDRSKQIINNWHLEKVVNNILLELNKLPIKE